ncbi:hypothetical protein [Methylorubrum extorquens]
MRPIGILPSTAARNPLATSEETIPVLRLARALSFEKPADIGRLIEQHRNALWSLGHLPFTITDLSAFQLSKSQAAYLIAVSGTERAVSLAMLMAELFAMFSAGKLVAVKEEDADEITAAQGREAVRGPNDAAMLIAPIDRAATH